jgi:hypothetical protein
MSDNNISYELQQIQSTLAALTDRLAASTATQVGGMQMYIAVGWSPIIALTDDGTYYYAQILDWTGGSGIKPPVMQYLCETGWTNNVAEAARVGIVGGGLPDGDKGDITVASGVWTIDNGVVTTLKLADRSVTAAKLFEVGHEKLIGRHGAGPGDAQEIGIDGGLELQGGNIRRSALTGDVTASAGGNATTIAVGAVTTAKMGGDVTAAGKALLDDADAAAQRTTLGLGTAATAATGDFAAASHTHTLSNLTQSGATTGQVAQWNGTAWVPATASGGAILKVASTSSSTSGSTTTIIPLDNTTPQSSEGAEIITLSFTPTSASSRVLVFFNFCYSSNVNTPIAALFFDSDASATCAAFLNTVPSSGYGQNAHVVFDLPSWSGAKTLKMRAGPNFYSGSPPAFFWNRITSGDVMNGTMKTTLTVIEYTP